MELADEADRGLQAFCNFFLIDQCPCLYAAIQCERPQNPLNGRAIYDSVSYNSLISYECNYGYMLIGDSVRRCERNKMWTGTEPTCKGTTTYLLLLFTTFTLSQCLIHEISDASWLICPGMLPHVWSAMCLSWFSICRTFRVEDSKISYMPKNWYRQVLSGVLILFILSDRHSNLPWIYNKGQFTILSLHLYIISIS